MTAETKTLSETQREISIEIPADVVARESDAIVTRYQKLARLPGFRRGKVPASILRQRFAEEIRSDLVESLVPRYFREEAARQGLRPVSQPRVSDLHVVQGEPLRFKAKFEVMPQIEVSGYREIEVPTTDSTVADDEVNAAIERLREQGATYETVSEDRPLADGDFAQAELTGTPQSPDAQPVHLDEVMVEVGGANTQSEFTENLRGARTGEQRTFDVTYPTDFSDQRLAGRTFTYRLKINAIKLKSVPELNDDFAKQVSADFATVEDLRQRVRTSLEQEKQREAETAAKETLLDELVRRNDFTVPESLVEDQIDSRLERGLRALAAQGLRPEDMKRMDMGRLRTGQREAALRDVKRSLLLERIAEKENIVIADEEVEREVETLALQARQPVEAVRARLTRGGALDRIRARLRNEKALEFLYRKPA